MHTIAGFCIGPKAHWAKDTCCITRRCARLNVFLPIFDLLFGNLGAEVYTENRRQALSERALGLVRAVTEGALVCTYLIVAFILFWCSFPASARRRSEARRIQAESPKSPS